MAGLFKNKIINDKIEKFEIPDFEHKLSLVQSWYNVYESGELQQKNETQCEQAFNQDFFINVLGYVTFPKDVYTIQPKDNVETGGGQIPDATLGYFKNGVKRVVAVVEIKDATTALDKSQRREGNLSPIQQAFKYKPQYKECGFVIATNFYEIRLFRDNQLDYEKFTLTDLVNPENDYFNFRKFYYLLCSQNFIAESGQTETEKILSAIRIEQEKITNKFYKEYKQLRQDLIRDIIDNNQEIKRADFYSHVVEKAQKIVDRLVFICFFEDAGLLPEDKLTEVVEYAQKGILDEPIWETLKKFFKAVDEGSERLGVPNGYNGELFKSDEDLNKLKISDAVCKRFVELSKFDFAEDLSVNILGHIFEQSISDLERLKNYSENQAVTFDKKEAKRKKDGIFYTPEYIVDYIVKNSLGKLFEEKEKEIFEKHNLDDKRNKEVGYNKKLVQAYTEYSQFLRGIKVLDPACGSGAFLVKVFDHLMAEHKRVFRAINEAEGLGLGMALFSDDEFIKPILENNIFGVDLNAESVEITKLSLWLKSAKKGQKLTTLKNNIKCGNSLVDDTLVAKEKAFDWSKEFPEIMNNGGFDVIVGNPPYVNIFNIKDEAEREYLKNTYKVSKNKTDLYAFFTEKSVGLLKEKGILGFIFSNSWLGTNSFSNFRNYLIDNTKVTSLVLLPAGVFQDATVTTIIIFLEKQKILNNDIQVKKLADSVFEDYRTLSYDTIRSSPQNTFNVDVQISIKVKTEDLGKLAKFSLGIKTSDDKRFIFKNKENQECLPAVNGKDIKRYYLPDPSFYIWYRPDLMMEKKGAGPRNIELFKKEKKIFIQDIAQSIIATIDDKQYLSNDTLSLIYELDDNFDWYYILGLLNSRFINFWFKTNFSTGLHIKTNQLKEIPVAIVDKEKQIEISKLVIQIISTNEKFQSILKKTKELLRHELSIEKLPFKLDNFYELSFDELIKFSKLKLSIDKKSQLIDFFTKEKDSLLYLKNEMNVLDQEIDEIVFKIYNLNPEDIDAIKSFKKQ